MNLASFTVRNFRNLAALDLELPTEGVVVLGENGQGKTNFLEAIYYLVLFRSIRGAKDRELVRFGTDGFFVAGTAQHHVTAGFAIAGNRKKVTVDGVEQRKLVGAVGKVAAVMFSPADREMVAGGPAARRRFLDILLSLSAPGYLAALSKLRAALKQRNAALRRGRVDEARAFDAAVARSGADVATTRRAWVATWHDQYSELCGALGENHPPKITYYAQHQRTDDAVETFERELAAATDRDLRRGMTTVGPHRDNLRLSLGGHDLRRYGSAGQQRTAAIALRLIEAAALATALRTPPIALYDDVFAELDGDRQARLLRLIQDRLPGQAVIAAPRESEVPTDLLNRPRWRMEGGRLAA